MSRLAPHTAPLAPSLARARPLILTAAPHATLCHAPSPPPRSLLAAGVKGLHLYTLNMEEACFSILESLDLKLPVPADA